jgi:hypothetical protein
VTAAEAAKGLRLLAAAVESGLIPPPARCWPLVFRTRNPGQMAAAAAWLSLEGAEHREFAEEDGSPWERIRGRAGAVPVELTADAGPVLLDELQPVAGVAL